MDLEIKEGGGHTNPTLSANERLRMSHALAAMQSYLSREREATLAVPHLAALKGGGEDDRIEEDLARPDKRWIITACLSGSQCSSCHDI